ncbi:DUF6455 family protein [Pelagimonas varians]|uniref:DUF6455 domain-containing protein n=1 Tax=Pelagimonas varians TaxID=696760 RepID=A0A238L4K7_9RHOB|nr:DUF6455 family protein [Pelagimonas varians]PYG26424.1 hypothetical protein C8N36_12344 [Pelagimonas varians]SMX49959.1 hypothetical protein PEV8663_04410 [Pelagimonas varians]
MSVQTEQPPKLVLGPEMEHFWLVQRMAKATGIDLVEAADADVMSQKDWASIVTHCRGCGWAEGCGKWLNKPKDEVRDLPSKCVNRPRLAEIKAELEEL